MNWDQFSLQASLFWKENFQFITFYVWNCLINITLPVAVAKVSYPEWSVTFLPIRIQNGKKISTTMSTKLKQMETVYNK